MDKLIFNFSEHQNLTNNLAKITDVEKMKDEAIRIALTFDEYELLQLAKKEDCDICKEYPQPYKDSNIREGDDDFCNQYGYIPRMWCVATAAGTGDLFEKWALKLVTMFPGYKSVTVLIKDGSGQTKYNRVDEIQAYMKLVKGDAATHCFILDNISSEEAIELSRFQDVSENPFIVIGRIQSKNIEAKPAGMENSLDISTTQNPLSTHVTMDKLPIIETMSGVIFVNYTEVDVIKHRKKRTNHVTEAINNIMTINLDELFTTQQVAARLATFIIQSCGNEWRL